MSETDVTSLTLLNCRPVTGFDGNRRMFQKQGVSLERLRICTKNTRDASLGGCAASKLQGDGNG